MSESSSSSGFSQPCRRISFAEIQSATQNFDESLIIGRGGFGKVYKATLFYGETEVVAAVKRLDSMSNQGAIEFRAEIDMLGKLRHCHLVSLIGYCDDVQEMILVYEYLPRGTLEDHLHKSRALSWVRRLKICLGVARGLDYLHTGTGLKHGVTHRDVKTSNILLHESWEAKISDFGLSRIGPTNQPATYVNTLVKGTFGYLDPDYFATGRLSRKSDVYAFGVVLFEVLSGKRAVDSSLGEEQWGLARWAQDCIKEGRLKQMVDSSIKAQISPKCLKEFARLAERCLHSHPKQRPMMAEIVVGLESVLALQVKTNSAKQPMGMTIFGRRMPRLFFPSNGETPSRSTNAESWKFLFETDGGLVQFEPHVIKVATENFSKANEIWEDRCVSLYNGKLQDGQRITVRKLNSDVLLALEECRNEALLLSQFEHENVVKLLGYCFGGRRVSLIYASALYTSLDRLIFDPEAAAVLDLAKRYKIILGVARGLVYLHENAPIHIVHSDVKPSNVMLTESMKPKLVGFGVARKLAAGETGLNSDHVCGTFGYVAPEYEIHGRLSTKADVYSFGVLMLETITGRKREGFLYDHWWYNWWNGTYSEMIHPSIDGYSTTLIVRYIQIGLLCVQEDADDRPTMNQVVSMLVSDSSLNLPIPKQPLPISESDEDSSDDHDSGATEDVMQELYSYKFYETRCISV